jgi:hypothetical protein
MRRRSGGLIAAALLLPEPAQAHAFALRYDLPLPLWLYLAGAGATVAVSFGLIAWLVRPGRPASIVLDLQTLPARAAGSVLRVLSVATLAMLIAAGLLGRQDPFANILPTFVWVIWWVGLA